MEVPAAVELITQVVSVFARVGVLLAGWGVIGLAWAAVATTSLTALVFLVLQLRLLFPPRLQWNRQFAVGLLRPALPLLLNSLLINVAFSFDSVYSARLHRRCHRGAVPHALSRDQRCADPAAAADQRGLPADRAACQQDRAAFNRAYRHTLHVALLAAFPITVGTTVLASDLVRFFAGAEGYLGISDPVLAILIWFLPLSYVNGLTQYIMIALDRQAAITRSFLIMAAFNLVANLLLIPLYGIYAASTDCANSDREGGQQQRRPTSCR